LGSLGWLIAPGHRLGSTHGWYRVNQRFDDTIVTWDVWAYRAGTNPDVGARHLVSYDTMTACARGCSVTPQGDGNLLWWVTATCAKGQRTT
jgi:hypothetical protein